MRSRSVRGIGPGPVATRRPRGLGLRLLKLPMGLANPLLVPRARMESNAGLVDAGATTATWSTDSPESSRVARMEAALSRTDGTECSSCSVPLALGMRCGFWCARKGGEGGTTGSMSRSKMAEEEEWLKKTRLVDRKSEEKDDHYTEVGEEGIEFGEREPRRGC